MPIDRFTKEKFEAALPAGHWKPWGFEYGEYCYLIPVTANLRIFIRSSVGRDGFASTTGDNSIRLTLVDQDNNLIGSKLTGRWITRVTGWNVRLLEDLRFYWRIARGLRVCPKCAHQEKVFRVRKIGPNEGRLFKSCECQSGPQWLT